MSELVARALASDIFRDVVVVAFGVAVVFGVEVAVAGAVGLMR